MHAVIRRFAAFGVVMLMGVGMTTGLGATEMPGEGGAVAKPIIGEEIPQAKRAIGEEIPTSVDPGTNGKKTIGEEIPT